MLAPFKDLNKTIFCDIDGTLLEHTGNMSNYYGGVLPGTLAKFHEWNYAGYYIILVTGRKESLRAVTEKYLTEQGIYWDQLIMGLPRGPRVIINDCKPDTIAPTAIAVNLERNKGIAQVQL